MDEKYWTHFFHNDNFGVCGVGATIDEAFEQAALALTAAVTNPANVAPNVAVAIICEATGDEELFTNWLNALAREMATRKMFFSRFDVCVKGHRLEATAWGEPIDVAKHEPTGEVKGAAHTDLQVQQAENRMWKAQCGVNL